MNKARPVIKKDTQKVFIGEGKEALFVARVTIEYQDILLSEDSVGDAINGVSRALAQKVAGELNRETTRPN